MGKRKCGQEKYSKILTGFLKDGESETISLNPEKVLSDIIQQAKKTLSSNFDDYKNIRKHYHRSGNQISDHNFSAWKTVRWIPMKTRFYISGGKN